MKETPLIERTARATLAAGMNLSEASSALRRQMILEALRDNRGNICHAAEALRAHRNTVARQMKDLGIGNAAREIRHNLPPQAELKFSGRRRPVGQANGRSNIKAA